MSLDTLPYYDLRHVCTFLGIEDMQSFSQLGPQYHEAATSIARRRYATFTLKECDYTAASLEKVCAYLAKFVHQLTVEFTPNPATSVLGKSYIVRLIASAEHLVDLTLVHAMCGVDFGPTLFGRIRRLRMSGVTTSEQYMQRMLATCVDGTLTELAIENMKLTGSSLCGLRVQLQALRIQNIVQFIWNHMDELNKRYPRLQKLEIVDTSGLMQRWNARSIYIYRHMANLAKLTELHTLHVAVDSTCDDLRAFLGSVGPKQSLRHLRIEARNCYFTEELGEKLRVLSGLESLHVHVYPFAEGVADLLRGVSAHPTLRELRLIGSDINITEIPPVMVMRMPNTESQQVELLVHTRMVPGTPPNSREPELRMLTLNVRQTLNANGKRERAALEDGYGDDVATAIAAKNRKYLCVQMVQDEELIGALQMFKQLRELKLVARCHLDSVTVTANACVRKCVMHKAGCDMGMSSVTVRYKPVV